MFVRPPLSRQNLQGTIVSLDGVYDCRANRKAIFNRGMIPNIRENPRGRKTPKRGRRPRFDPAIFEERFRTIERVFAWEDKFRRLLLRFEHISDVHYAFKTLAYTLINASCTVTSVIFVFLIIISVRSLHTIQFPQLSIPQRMLTNVAGQHRLARDRNQQPVGGFSRCPVPLPSFRQGHSVLRNLVKELNDGWGV